MGRAIKKWKAYFKIGKENLEDDDRGGRPTTTTEENIAHVHRVVMDDRACLTTSLA